MFQLFEHYIPNFRNLTKKKELHIILNGININQDELLSTHITLTFGVQKFIMQTKDFKLLTFNQPYSLWALYQSEPYWR